MQIKNEYRDTIYWRAFKKDDTAYWVGLKQGSVKPGGTDSWRDDSYPNVKLEAKVGDIVFSSKVLATPGRLFNMTDDIIVNASGLTVATVQLEHGKGQITERRSDVQFVDLRSFNGPVERTVTSKVETTFSSSESFESSHAHEQTWSVGGKIGGTIGKKDVASGSAELSAGYQDKVVDALKISSGQAVSSVWGQTWTDKFQLAGGKLYAIEVVWTMTLDKGLGSYMGKSAEFTVVRSASPTITKPAAFDSEADMGAANHAYLEKWNEAARV